MLQLMYSLYPAAMRTEGKWPDHLYNLYIGEDTPAIRRAGNKTIVASTSKGWFASMTDRFARSKAFPFEEGDSVQLDRMTAKILTCTNDGRPLEVAFHFKDTLESFTWLRWDKSGPVPFVLPPIGATKKLRASLF